MRKSDLIALVDSPVSIQKEQIPELQNVINEYPYFTSAQLLLTKAYHQSENLNFEKQLRLSAAYASDRRKLHDLIHGDFSQQKTESTEAEQPIFEQTEVLETKNKLPQPSTLSSEDSEMVESFTEEDAFLESQILTSAINSSILQEVGGDDAESLQIPEQFSRKTEEENLPPSSFNETAEHSFNDWLNHFSGTENTSEKTASKSTAIKAISEQAKQIQEKAEFFSASKMAKLSVIESDDLVTETLAKVYVAQGKFERAIQAYQKLQLKFPEKRVYFAGRIKAVEEKLKS